MIRSLLVLTLFACGPQDDPPKAQAAPADAKWKADFKLSLVERDGRLERVGVCEREPVEPAA